MQADEMVMNSGEYREKREFCYCFSLKCGIITAGCLLFIDFVISCLDIWEISRNDHFNNDKTYLYGYIGLIAILFVAVNLFFWYLVLKDSPQTRALIPWAFLVASIANLLIAIWIIYYISVMYPENKIYTEKPRSYDDDDEFGHHFDEGDEGGDGKSKKKEYKI